MPENGFPSFQENYASPMTRRIEDWKSRLIDLSRRNNLLYFKPSKRGNLSVSRPNMERIFNRLALRKRHLEFWYPPVTDMRKQQSSSSANLSLLNGTTSPKAKQLVCRETSRSDLEKILKNLHRRSLLDYRERGVRILHAAFGMLVWKEKETGEEVRRAVGRLSGKYREAIVLRYFENLSIDEMTEVLNLSSTDSIGIL